MPFFSSSPVSGVIADRIVAQRPAAAYLMPSKLIPSFGSAEVDASTVDLPVCSGVDIVDIDRGSQ